MKRKIAIGISIMSFVIIELGLNVAADFLGLPTYIDFGETIIIANRLYDREIDGSITDVGYFIHIVSIMLAWRIYHWVFTGKVNGNISRKSHITWLYWLAGMSVYILVATLIKQIDMPVFLSNIISLGCAVIIYCFMHNKCRDTLKK